MFKYFCGSKTYVKCVFRNENFLDLDDQIPLLADIENFDYEKMLGFTSELIALEVVNRVCITLVEVI